MSSDFSRHIGNKSYGCFGEHSFLNFVYFPSEISNKISEKNESLKN
jgi:hypothetical protein